MSQIKKTLFLSIYVWGTHTHTSTHTDIHTSFHYFLQLSGMVEILHLTVLPLINQMLSDHLLYTRQYGNSDRYKNE